MKFSFYHSFSNFVYDISKLELNLLKLQEISSYISHYNFIPTHFNPLALYLQSVKEKMMLSWHYSNRKLRTASVVCGSNHSGLVASSRRVPCGLHANQLTPPGLILGQIFRVYTENVIIILYQTRLETHDSASQEPMRELSSSFQNVKFQSSPYGCFGCTF